MTTPTPDAVRADLARHLAALQDEICAALERLDGSARFARDAWERPGGGGGVTRVLQEGAVLEKAGVSFSDVHGELPEAFARRLQGEGRAFAAVGLSLVLHPRSPLVPTTHANFRYIVQGGKAWFGGGSDLTPYYIVDDDAAHFHRTLKAACDRHDAGWYPRFKRECDRYFFLLLRQRHYALACAAAVLAALAGAAVETRRAAAVATAAGAARRGDLETGGRTESILMSLPPKVRWAYEHHPAPGTEEARLIDVLRAPREWA